jgi:hypothetical protein
VGIYNNDDISVVSLSGAWEMVFVIQIERVNEVAEEVTAAFSRIRSETLSDMRMIDLENKNKVDAEILFREHMTGLTHLPSGGVTTYMDIT